MINPLACKFELEQVKNDAVAQVTDSFAKTRSTRVERQRKSKELQRVPGRQRVLGAVDKYTDCWLASSIMMKSQWNSR